MIWTINDIFSKKYAREIKGIALYLSLYKVSPVIGGLLNYFEKLIVYF